MYKLGVVFFLLGVCGCNAKVPAVHLDPSLCSSKVLQVGYWMVMLSSACDLTRLHSLVGGGSSPAQAQNFSTYRGAVTVPH